VNGLDAFVTGTILIPEVIYDPNAVSLEAIQGLFASLPGLTPNQRTVARNLDTVTSDPRADDLINSLDAELLGKLPNDLDLIAPEELTSIYEISFSAANIQAANLEERFAEIRNGSTGFSSSLNISNAPRTIVEGKDGKAIMEPDKGVMTPSPENKWGVWISGSGHYVSVSNDGNGSGYDFTTGGVTLGLDYRLSKNLAVGIALGYAHTWTNLTGNGWNLFWIQRSGRPESLRRARRRLQRALDFLA
jgi:outer membrane autotransporter protein